VTDVLESLPAIINQDDLSALLPSNSKPDGLWLQLNAGITR
jgi:hypothetical protein